MNENNGSIRMNSPMNASPNLSQFKNPGSETIGNVSSVTGNSYASGPRLGPVRMNQPDSYLRTDVADSQQGLRQQQNYQASRFPQNGDQFRFPNNPNLQRDNNQPRVGDIYQNAANIERQRATMGPSQNQQYLPGTQPRFSGPPPQARPPMPGQSLAPGQTSMSNQPPGPDQPILPSQPNMPGQPRMPRQPQPLQGQPPLSRQSSIASIDPTRLSISQNHNLSNQPNVQKIQEENVIKKNDEEKQLKNLSPNLVKRSSKLDLNELNSQGKECESEVTVMDSKSDSSEDEDLIEKEEKNSELEASTVGNKSRFEKKGKKPPKGLIEDENIPSGKVRKNIQFFEDQDTTKIPLIPNSIPPKKAEKTEKSSAKILKKKNKNVENESGVDETPMIHPNLRSIYETPSKVAKMSLLKFGKIGKSRKGKGQSEKKNFIKWDNCYSTSSKSISKTFKKNLIKKKNVPNFSPEEELLAFFHNSQAARLKRDAGIDRDRKALTKDFQGKKSTLNGDIPSPKKTPSKLPGPKSKNPTLSSPTKTPLKSPASQGAKSLPKTPESPLPPEPLIKKVPMNKIQVGAAPSPNLKAARSKVGSLINTTHKPGGGNIRIENHKIDFSKAQSRIEAKNDQYVRSGGDKKIPQVKLQWEAKSKVGSLENATYKPGGGERKIESVKLDFREKAKPKVGSKDNVKHVPGGGTVKIESQKLEFKAQSKVGSLDNVKHKPGGGDVKIFDDKTYLKQISSNTSEGRVSGTQSFGDISVVREVEGRSAPATPGHKIVKIKKTTTIRSAGAAPHLKNVTEVTVASRSPKKSAENFTSKQQIKLTLSKTSPAAEVSSNNEHSVEVIKTPAKDFAPVLKPSLSRNEANNNADDIYGKGVKQFNSRTSDKSESLDHESSWNEKKKISESSDLHDGKFNSRNDSGASKFLRDEMAAQEKVEKIWLERNNMEANGKRENPVKPNQEVSFSTAYRAGNMIPQTQTVFSKAEKLVEPTASDRNLPVNFSSSSSNLPNANTMKTGQYRVGFQNNPTGQPLQNANQQMNQEKYQILRSNLQSE